MEESTTMKALVNVKWEFVDTTLKTLQHAGKGCRECVVLWLGHAQGSVTTVQQVFVPIQDAADDYFRIPREGIAALLRQLRTARLQVAVQVHSHPSEAFHSPADDTWAIIRHAGALSLVVPYFGLRTTTETFIQDTVVYELCSNNQWCHIPDTEVSRHYQVHA